MAVSNYAMPGHLARRFQQIAVAAFVAEVEAAGFDLTPVQYAALVAISASPAMDQITLATMIAYDRTTIGGVVHRLARKGLVERRPRKGDMRAHELLITKAGRSALDGMTPAVMRAQRLILRGLSKSEAGTLMLLLRKAITAGSRLAPPGFVIGGAKGKAGTGGAVRRRRVPVVAPEGEA